MKTEGIFRITGSDVKVRELELHMSQGNYPFLKQAKPHTVTNYMKRVLREMKQPLIPLCLYDFFLQNSEEEEFIRVSAFLVDQEQKELLNIKFLLNRIPELNFNTLKYLIQFFWQVVEYEPDNKMTAYNIAVTVGPNIFR